MQNKLITEIKTKMMKKGIRSYKELAEICGMPNNERLDHIFYGRKKIKEGDLLKIAKILEIPMKYFEENMDVEKRYYISEKRKNIEEEGNKIIEGLMKRNKTHN